MNESLLEAAREMLPEIDYIFNLYDLTPEWASDELLRLLEYDDISDIRRVTEILDFETEDEKRTAATEAVILTGTKISNGRFRTRTGRKLLVKLKLMRFEFEGTPYEIGKVLECAEKKK